MQTHELKSDPEQFELIVQGIKKFELRINDRDYRSGDTLILMETEHSALDMKAGKPLVYTGRRFTAKVVHIFKDSFLYDGLTDGWCIMSLHGGGFLSIKQTVPADAIKVLHKAFEEERLP